MNIPIQNTLMEVESLRVLRGCNESMAAKRESAERALNEACAIMEEACGCCMDATVAIRLHNWLEVNACFYRRPFKQGAFTTS